MGTIQKFILGAIGIIIVGIFIAWLVGLLNQSKDLAAIGGESLSNDSRTVVESLWSAWDYTTATGSEVRNALTKYRESGGDVIIVVETVAGGSVQYISTGAVDTTNFTIGGTLTAVADPLAAENNTKDKNNSAYLNPNAKFECHVLRDSAGEIRGFHARQQ